MKPQVNFNRRAVLASLLPAALLLDNHTARGEEDFGALYVPDEIDRAVNKGVDYLVSVKRPDGSVADHGHTIAMSSLAIMAMAAIGTQPGDKSARGEVMQAALDYVLKDGNQDREGYFGGRDGSRMYGHGITTLMLTEMLGMGASIEQNEKIHRTLNAAIKLILNAQSVRKTASSAGGWRYGPGSTDSDLSVSVWQLMALRSAKNDGLDVPSQAIEKAINYLKNSYTSQQRRGRNGGETISGFSYTPGHHHPTFTMTAAGLLAMQVCGQYDSPMVRGASEWLLRNKPRNSERFFFYGIYYYSQGMHQAGGKYAEEANKLVPALLLDMQRSNGSWVARGGEERNIGTVYSTAMAILSLSVRYHYLPIYQR